MISRDREEHVDEGGDVANVDCAVAVHIGVAVDRAGTAQQVIDQGGDIADVDLAVAIHIARLYRPLR